MTANKLRCKNSEREDKPEFAESFPSQEGHVHIFCFVEDLRMQMGITDVNSQGLTITMGWKGTNTFESTVIRKNASSVRSFLPVLQADSV